MVTKKQLISNALMRTLISIKHDTFMGMMQQRDGYKLPAVGKEGATGDLENYGAIFLPRIVSWDVEKKEIPIDYFTDDPVTEEEFTHRVMQALSNDAATVISHDGISANYQLPTSNLAELATHVIESRRSHNGGKSSQDITLRDIVKSCSPKYIANQNEGTTRPMRRQLPNGRTNVSSALSVLLQYYSSYQTELKFHEPLLYQMQQETELKPVTGEKGKLLAPDCVVVCHTTRYKKNATNYASIIKMMGYEPLSFSTFTLESATNSLLGEFPRKKKFARSDFFGGYRSSQGKETYVVGVLRSYKAERWGTFPKLKKIQLVTPRELDLDLVGLTQQSTERYTKLDKKRILYPKLE